MSLNIMILFSDAIIMKLYIEHGSDTTVLCVKFHNDWAIELDVMRQRNAWYYSNLIYISIKLTVLQYTTISDQ